MGFSSGYISRIERGERQPPDKIIKAICREYGAYEEWLRTGEGPRRRPEGQARAMAELTIVGPGQAGPGEERSAVPLLADAAAAGEPAAINEADIEGYIVVPVPWIRAKHCTAVRVRGESMLPVLAGGDIVIINHARCHEPELLRGKIVAARVEGGVTIKYLRRDERNWILQPANPEFDPIIRPLEEQIVVGPVEWAWRKFE